MKDFELIEGFMLEISKSIGHQITLTDEDNPQFPLIMIESQQLNNNKVD